MAEWKRENKRIKKRKIREGSRGENVGVERFESVGVGVLGFHIWWSCCLDVRWGKKW